MLGIVLALAIVCVLTYLSIKAYFKGSPVDKADRKSLQEQGVSASNPASATQAAKANVDEMNKRSLEMQKQSADMEGAGQ